MEAGPGRIETVRGQKHHGFANTITGKIQDGGLGKWSGRSESRQVNGEGDGNFRL
jgi:hypothetical protein